MSADEDVKYGQSELGIPRKLGHIWIGELPPPVEWMDTWRAHHPDWEYTLYGNEFLESYNFKTRRQIAEYIKRGQYAGAADLMRLEILYEFGGFLPGADSICFRNTDELFVSPCLYSVYENEFVRGRLVSPIQASPPKSGFLEKMISVLADTDPAVLDDPWVSTGNLFTALMLEKYKPEAIIFPSHYLIPVHFTGVAYSGDGPIYAKQMFGSTRGAYVKYGRLGRFWSYMSSLKKRAYRVRRLKVAKKIKSALFD